MRWISAIAKMLVCLWLALAVVPSWAQRPPTNDVSDRMGNTGGGTGALTSITTGGANTAYGNAALRTNTTGGNNTAVGTLALSFSDTGNNNTGVGSSTLEINGAGDNNTAVGSQLGARIERVVYHDEDNRNAGRFLPRRSRPSSWWRYEAEAEAPWMRRAWVDSGVRSDALQGARSTAWRIVLRPEHCYQALRLRRTAARLRGLTAAPRPSVGIHAVRRRSGSREAG
jgi:hypothetical protein